MSAANATEFNVFGDYCNVINGKLQHTTQSRNGINPATGDVLPDVPVASLEEVNIAVNAAQKAFKTWSRVSFEERRKKVLDLADALEGYASDFAKLLTQEQGKPVSFGEGEVHATAAWIRGLANIELKDEVVEEDDQKKTIIRYMPLGVIVGIIPWNFPIHLACGKLVPAVLTGNCIILKPSPFTPYCNLKLAELAQQFFPPGVVQALSGDDNLGPWLVEHPGPAKISFTGSTQTGKKVMASAAKTLKRVTLELGGLDPAIICPDVDIDAIVPTIATMAFINSGQLCLAIKRVYVHEKIHGKFLDALVKFTKTLKVGNGMEEGVFFGPVQNAPQYEKVRSFFADIEREKIKIALGGDTEQKKGYFITPTIVDKPSDTARVATEEVFGPILPLMTWRTDEEVIARSNNTKMGLGASVWSSDIERANRIAERLEAGSVWVNAHFEPSPNGALAGHKESGIGSEGGLSGMRGYCNIQTLYLKKARL